VTVDAPPRRLEDTPLGPAAGGLYRHQSALTGLAAGVVVGFLGWAAAHELVQAGSWGTDRVVAVTMVGWIVGFTLGVGAGNAPLQWVVGRRPTAEDHLYWAGVGQGRARYWKYCTDHKVVGIQYLVLTMVLFGIGGGLAMLIRTQLLTPHSTFLNPNSYNAVVSIHGTAMIIATIVMVTGPFANFVVPLMIGARDMAFPRLNALSFWLLVSAVPCLLATFVLGGVDAGWTTYAPLSIQAPVAMDAFAVAIIAFALSATIGGINLIVTVLTMRAPGMTPGRLPIFTWGSVVGSALGLCAMPAFLLVMLMVLSDRTMGTSLFDAAVGGSGWLYENLFWIMGHPEVYVILIPPVAALFEVVSTFARKPVFGYRIVVGAFVAIGLLSLAVWAHHMFTSGWAPDLAVPFMASTELISLPTGLLVLCLIGTLWDGYLWPRLPLYFAYLFVWDFVIGGVTGIYLSDVPADQFFHGDMFVTAHFHYALMGGAMIGATAAVCYWFPKITGRMLDERIGKVAFWIIAVGIQVTFAGQFWAGLQGMPRRVAWYNPVFQHANQTASVGAYLLMAGWIVFLYAMVRSAHHGRPAPANPWRAKSLEWQVPSPVPLENFAVQPVVTSDPYGYGQADDAPGGPYRTVENSAPVGRDGAERQGTPP